MVSEPRCRAGVPAKLGPERGEGWRDPTSGVEENKPRPISRGGNLNHRGAFWGQTREGRDAQSGQYLDAGVGRYNGLWYQKGKDRPRPGISEGLSVD